MTILPKKKEGEESDNEASGETSHSPPAGRPSLPPGAHSGPSRSPDASGGTFLPSSDGYYHRYICGLGVRVYVGQLLCAWVCLLLTLYSVHVHVQGYMCITCYTGGDCACIYMNMYMYIIYIVHNMVVGGIRVRIMYFSVLASTDNFESILVIIFRQVYTWTDFFPNVVQVSLVSAFPSVTHAHTCTCTCTFVYIMYMYSTLYIVQCVHVHVHANVSVCTHVYTVGTMSTAVVASRPQSSLCSPNTLPFTPLPPLTPPHPPLGHLLPAEREERVSLELLPTTVATTVPRNTREVIDLSMTLRCVCVCVCIVYV